MVHFDQLQLVCMAGYCLNFGFNIIGLGKLKITKKKSQPAPIRLNPNPTN